MRQLSQPPVGPRPGLEARRPGKGWRRRIHTLLIPPCLHGLAVARRRLIWESGGPGGRQGKGLARLQGAPEGRSSLGHWQNKCFSPKIFWAAPPSIQLALHVTHPHSAKAPLPRKSVLSWVSGFLVLRDSHVTFLGGCSPSSPPTMTMKGRGWDWGLACGS